MPASRAVDPLGERLHRRLALLDLASSGVAMKIEEYVPAAMPTNSASDRSLSVPAPRMHEPTNRIAPTGSRAMIEVLIDRTSVWLTARFAASL